jgi:ribulose-phosphate 3-epimerase
MAGPAGLDPSSPLRGVHIVPSILSADFARLGACVQEVLDAGARMIQVDVMDGHFVPPISVGALVVASLREQMRSAGALIDVHLMVERPERHIAAYASAGADNITVHAEATPHVRYAVDQVHEHGLTAGVALNPSTSPEAVREMLGVIELVLCMTVNPGWGGQAFIPESLEKLRRLRGLVGNELGVQIDGGVDLKTAGPARQAGATLFVAGSAVFDAPDPGEAFRALAAAVGER